MKPQMVTIDPRATTRAEAYLAARRRYYETDADLPEATEARCAMIEASRDLADDALRIILGLDIAGAAAHEDSVAADESSARFKARAGARLHQLHT